MWRPWSKVSALIHNSSVAPSSSSSSPSTSKFSCSTFKDIHNLCSDESINHHHHQQQLPSSKRPSPVFTRVRIATSLIRNWSSSRHSQLTNSTDQTSIQKPNEECCTSTSSKTPPAHHELNLPSRISGAEQRIVVYFTSLRVVRSTFEDCKYVRSIISGFPVSIDERDLSMDSSFMEELRKITGESKLTLPRVFIGGKYTGGADEIRHLHEMDELKKIIEGLPVVESGVCEGCGGYRFILCGECYGSHKVYTDKNGFRICSICNQNGLIRCPSCFQAHL